MLRVLLLTLAVVPSYSWPVRVRDRTQERMRVPGENSDATPGRVLFQFAPSDGTGMGAACACTTPTGAEGEVVTFTRASSAYCTKHNEWSLIANGDLVQCSTNQPLVMPGSDGSGPMGTLEEDPITNRALRSQEFDNAAWANFTAGIGANPTKGSADTDVAPDNTTTAEKVTFAATLVTDSSGLQQTIMAADAGALSVYARDNTTTLGTDGGNVDGGLVGGTFDLAMDTAASIQCGTCAYTAGSWNRCTLENVGSKLSGKIYIGNLSSICGGSLTRPAQTVTLWGAQAEPGANIGAIVTSYAPSGAAVGSRASSQLTFPVTIPASTKASLATTMVSGPTLVGGTTMATVTTDTTSSNNSYSMIWSPGAGNLNFRVSSVSNSVLPSPSTLPPLNTTRIWMAYDGATVSGCIGATCLSAAKSFTPLSGANTIMVGRRLSTTTNFHPNRVLKQICFDTSFAGCR